ncbi:MAG TPA: ROK family protein [Dongiaceae bacterium]|nr:ROK family protein [Dongiaceae bacterium]
MIAGVDIGGTKVAVGMVNENGQVLAKRELPTDPEGGYANFLDRIVSMLREISTQAGAPITGIGIGSTGPLYAFTGEFGDVNFFPKWKGQNPVLDLQRTFQVSVAMENDGDAAALGEAGWGAGRGKSNLIYVTVGTGIGVGIVLDGKLYRGADDYHPEIGHHLIDPSGPLCDCGFHGCWESMCAGPAMAKWFESNAQTEYSRPSPLNAKKICELARRGDTSAQRAVEREARYLGLGLANLVTMFVPEMIIMGGSVMKSADLFLDGIRRIIATSCRLVPFEKTQLALASLGEDTNLIGAARVWYYRCAPEA